MGVFFQCFVSSQQQARDKPSNAAAPALPTHRGSTGPAPAPSGSPSALPATVTPRRDRRSPRNYNSRQAQGRRRPPGLPGVVVLPSAPQPAGTPRPRPGIPPPAPRPPSRSPRYLQARSPSSPRPAGEPPSAAPPPAPPAGSRPRAPPPSCARARRRERGRGARRPCPSLALASSLGAMAASVLGRGVLWSGRVLGAAAGRWSVGRRQRGEGGGGRAR